MPRLNAAEKSALEEFGFAFEPVPERATTRRGKHHDRFVHAKELAVKFPGQSLRVIAYENASQAYSLAKAINSRTRGEFVDEPEGRFSAQTGKYVGDEGEDLYGVYLTCNASE